MYKLVNKGRVYELHRHNSEKYEMIGKVTSTSTLMELVETFAPRIQLPELDTALKFMVRENHNVAEFGYNGIFTVSYAENTL